MGRGDLISSRHLSGRGWLRAWFPFSKDKLKIRGQPPGGVSGSGILGSGSSWKVFVEKNGESCSRGNIGFREESRRSAKFADSLAFLLLSAGNS